MLRTLLILAAAVAAGCTSTTAAPADRTPPWERERHERVEGSAARIEAPWLDPKEPVASVDGQVLTRGEFYRRIIDRFGTRKILVGIVKEILIRREAGRLRIRVDPGRLREAVDGQIAQMAENAGGKARLEETLRDEGLSLKDLRDGLEKDAEIEFLTAEVVRSRRKPDPASLRAYYEQTYARERFAVRHIAVPYAGDGGDETKRREEALSRARALRKRIVEGGEDFEKVAREASGNRETARLGGSLGYLDREVAYPDEIKAVIFSLKPGEVSEPVEEKGYGHHLFRVDEKVPPQPFEACREKIRREILALPPAPEEIQRVLRELRRKADVRIFVP